MGVICMGLQTSPYELAFEVELAKFMSLMVVLTLLLAAVSAVPGHFPS